MQKLVQLLHTKLQQFPTGIRNLDLLGQNRRPRLSQLGTVLELRMQTRSRMQRGLIYNPAEGTYTE